MNLSHRLRAPPGRRFRLRDVDPEATPGADDKEEARARTARAIERLAELQYRLYAENRRAVLIVLQAMDAGGKDGTIRHVMAGMNPQGCRVTAFKAPTAEELAHDFLWRVHRAAPRRGEIGVFNRSHYEDVLIARVHNLVPPAVWRARYEQINAFERLLTDTGVTIVKFFLYIDAAEQKRRLTERLTDPAKNWKVAPTDFEERRHWRAYMQAYEVALARCSTRAAPWFVIPANKKWYRNFAVARILHETLEAMNPRFPKPPYDLSAIKI